MVCWYCYWGWAKPVAEIYVEAVKRLEAIGSDKWALHYGPSHIVWDDENWDSVEFCLKECNSHTEKTKEEIEIIKWSLEELNKIPLEEREIEPEDYDGLNPENYPPAKEVMKVY